MDCRSFNLALKDYRKRQPVMSKSMRYTVPFVLAAGALAMGVVLIGPDRFSEIKFAVGGVLVGAGVRILSDLAGLFREDRLLP
jgi:hypothetical protein